MTYALLSHGTIPGSANGTTSAGVNCSGASLIVVCVSSSNGFPTLTDSNSNTYTVAVRSASAGSSHLTTILFCDNPIASAGQTFTTAAASSFSFGAIMAFSGAATSAVLDQTNSSTSSQPGSITPSQNNELIVTGYCDANVSPLTINSGFTITDQAIFVSGTNYAGGGAYLIQTSAAAVNPTWAGTTQPASAIASFKPGAGAPSSVSNFFFAAG